MIRLSRNDLEQIAERVLAAYRKQMAFAENNIFRVDPIQMLKLLRLKLDHCHLSQNGAILGLTSFSAISVEVMNEKEERFFYDLDGKTILVDLDLQRDVSKRGRYHFTVMHEASHQILAMLFPEAYKPYALRIQYCVTSEWRSPVLDWEEWQANALASALLMPKDLILQGMHRCDLGEQISMLNRKYHSNAYKAFGNLADLLGVSMTALAIRMKYLGLLKEEYLKDPDAVIDIVWDE